MINDYVLLENNDNPVTEEKIVGSDNLLERNGTHISISQDTIDINNLLEIIKKNTQIPII